jgi:pimeloyl-ACP methyl ester carboxylesterase
MAELAAFDVSARLGEIDCPTLIVHGDRDSLLPVENGRELAKRIKGSLYHEIAGAGHAYMVQDPDVVNTAVAEFLRG